MIRTLLIANRGEIACRIARTARRMGIVSVAVHSDADADALHVRACDLAVRIGPAPARESYLNIAAILDAARRTGADAVHPGYGFLSENAAFAESCAQAGLVFVGPSPAAIRAMGSKSAAKALMEQAGVPLLPGYHGAEQDPALLAAEAARIGFPVVIKAVAGGGGRGMRVVDRAADFADALAGARQEAASSFGDDRVLVERYLTRPRHIEVQVFGDSHGNAVHLFERDCSVQRRHQKVLEEAPAPGLSGERRAAMGAAAVAAARAVDYVGAGTVEFVADDSGFFFLEMNTRLQVEHPVTEAITGFDLVEWQLRVAAGEALPRTQDQIRAEGHAIEARLYAEDPSRDYAPATGRLLAFRMPADMVRVDTGFAAGDTVGVHYDAMLAKLIAHGRTRADALAQLAAALAEAEVAGLTTNLDLLARIVAHPDFVAGGVDTGFIARHADTLLAPAEPPTGEACAVAALALLVEQQPPEDALPWDSGDGWWLNAAPERSILLLSDAGEHRVTVRREADGWGLGVGGARFIARGARARNGVLDLVLDGLRERAGVVHEGEALSLRLRGRRHRFRLPRAGGEAEDQAASGGRLVAPIPGRITATMAAAGDAVVRGAVLVTMEAMKTVYRLTAPADAVVAEMRCAEGELVEEGAVLVTFADPEA